MIILHNPPVIHQKLLSRWVTNANKNGTNNIKLTCPMQTIFHLLTVGLVFNGPQQFALGPRGFLDINTVSEIKGAPCTRCAHFHGRVHDFRRCAPGVCTFFEPFIIAIYWEGAWSNFRVHSFMGSAPCECTKYKLNFGHCNIVMLINAGVGGVDQCRAPMRLGSRSGGI